jgi:hypothetical protein
MAAMQDLPKRRVARASESSLRRALVALLTAAALAACNKVVLAEEHMPESPPTLRPAPPLLITLGPHSKTTHLTRHSKYQSRVGYTRFKAGIGSPVSALSTMIAGALMWTQWN